MKSRLSCNKCLKHLHCDILNQITKIKNGVQLKLLDTKDTLQNKLSELEEQQIKCLKRRIYLHKRFPKYILFRDEKYVHSDDEYYLYQYCNKGKRISIKLLL